MGNSKISLDESRFPLVILTLRGELLDEDYRAMFSQIERLMSLGRRYIMISDLRAITKVADAKKRQEIAAWSAGLEAKYGHLSAGSIMILESALVRGSLTALQWLSGKKDRDIWVGNMADAWSAAQKIARESGLSIPHSPGAASR